MPSRFLIHNSYQTVLISRTEKNQSDFYFSNLFTDVESVNLPMQLFLSLNLKIYQNRGGVIYLCLEIKSHFILTLSPGEALSPREVMETSVSLSRK